MNQPSNQTEFFGRMTDPTSASTLKGPCGDEMEFYLYISDDIIEDIKYYTSGCANTRNCGYAVAQRAKGRKVIDALAINPAEIIRSGECEPEKGRHCAILAVSSLYRAIAGYLLMS
jgi:nitrogen fixation NifU-like protein